MPTRRSFLHHGLTAATATAIAATTPRPLLANLGRGLQPLPSIEDPQVKALVHRALDAARSAGARYADVRLTHTRGRFIKGSAAAVNFEWMTAGVRGLMTGGWGFASSPVWGMDEMTQLARNAVHQATAGAVGRTRAIELASLSEPAQGHWEMPVAIDPFTVPEVEIKDFLSSIDTYAKRRAVARGWGLHTQGAEISMFSRDVAYGSSDGAYCTQRLYRTGGGFDWKLKDTSSGNVIDALLSAGISVGGMDYFSFAGLGWELFRGQPLREYADRAIEEAIEDVQLPREPVDIGRYETVWDASSVARITSPAIGLATEADRVFGYEANASGTSYLNAPLEMLGTHNFGTPQLTITANRTDPGGVATVKWDDEGVAAQEFTLVNKGILTDLSTTRESAGWIQDYYAKAGLPLRSHGCAHGAEDVIGRGMNLPMAHSPNLTMHPGAESLDFEACVAGMTKGIAFRRMKFDMDFQQLSGLGIPEVAYKIRNGKRVAILTGAGILLQTPELWKSLTTLGGAKSQRRFGMSTIKGEPMQMPFRSVSAVPAVFRNISVIDIMRKA